MCVQKVTATLKPGSYTLQRYKGLGEMMPDQLWSTTMDPATRQLVRLTVDDALMAQETFMGLMGPDVSKRRQLIQELGNSITNLDI